MCIQETLYVISDIHANLPALNAVLNQIPQNADIICAGDIVGYYTEPNEVCEALRTRSVACILGNHDLYVLNQLDYIQSNEAKYRVHWTRSVLTDENRAWLRQLPRTLTLKKQQTIHVYHGSMANIEEYIYPDTPIDHLNFKAHAITILGHTHHPMIRYPNENTCIMNPGSVGQPRDRNPAASFAVINLKTKSVTIKRVAYDVKKYQEKLKQQQLTDTTIRILSRTIHERANSKTH